MNHSILMDRLNREVRKRFEDWKFQFAHEWTNLVDRHLGNLMPYGDAETLRLQLGWLANKLLHDDDVRRGVHTTDLPHVESAFRDWFMDELLDQLGPDRDPAEPAAAPAPAPSPDDAGPTQGDTPPSPDDQPF